MKPMNPLSSIAGAYKRWRHSRGFGVHSPFAYNLVTNAIRPGAYSYYGYDLIDDILLDPNTPTGRWQKRDARLLLRILVTLGCRHLWIAPPGQPVFHAAANGAGAECHNFSTEVPDGKDNFLLLWKDGCDTKAVESWLAKGIPLMAINPSPEISALVSKLVKRGTVFSGTRITVAIPREEMALAEYSMKF